MGRENGEKAVNGRSKRSKKSKRREGGEEDVENADDVGGAGEGGASGLGSAWTVVQGRWGGLVSGLSEGGRKGSSASVGNAVMHWWSKSDKLTLVRNLTALLIISIVVNEFITEQQQVRKIHAVSSFVGDAASSLTSISELDQASAMAGSDESANGGADYLRQLQVMAGGMVVTKTRKADGELDEDTDNVDIIAEGRMVTGNHLFAENPADDKTTRLAQILAGVVITYNISSVADLSCRHSANFTADLHDRLLSRVPHYKYYCLDHDSVLLHSLISLWKSNKHVYFLRRKSWDRTFLRLPSAELYFALDSMQRLSLDRLHETFLHMKEAGVKYLMTTINPNRRNPTPGTKYKFSRLDFHSEPFFFPEPLRRFSDLTNDPSHLSNPKQLSLWRLDEIKYPDFDSTTMLNVTQLDQEAQARQFEEELRMLNSSAFASSDESVNVDGGVIGRTATIDSEAGKDDLKGSVYASMREKVGLGDRNNVSVGT
ncbi:hypothetical protein FVE85_4042 [Porphyridium purpureum]|uniref:Uncharacterized protein n=1 Tax=Porphyridium purpureum TaxID=35688 RepID=A0A5J4YUH6_PORPP|nr:hypothetical protein FVE85_4042 [Porphyridium purpureum]|eukprot:POR7788..scf229_5